MISKRLTKEEKNKIVEGFRDGNSPNELAQKFSCSSNTINRTVKSLIPEKEYTFLKEKRLKENNTKNKLFSRDLKTSDTEDLDNIKSYKKEEDPFGLSSSSEISSGQEPPDSSLGEIKDTEQIVDTTLNQFSVNNFEVIAPLASGFDLDHDIQKVECKTLDKELLPESAYMIVDKKVELESQSISDLPEWSFLPDDELKRQAILLFPNQRSAKRSCSRNQRVIKIPNTDIFLISRPYLISKGITRLILEDSLIALDQV